MWFEYELSKFLICRIMLYIFVSEFGIFNSLCISFIFSFFLDICINIFFNLVGPL